MSRRTSPEAVETCPIRNCGSQPASRSKSSKEGFELDAVNEVGGADRDRTGDPLLAKQVLSQLSYSPFKGCVAKMVGLGRVELPTSPLSGVRSNQLSYRPALRAPPPISCRRLAQISFNANGFRGQRLNMLRSYATHDDRKSFRPGKEGLYRISCILRKRLIQDLHGHLSDRRSDSAIAEGISVPCVLF